MYRHQIVENTTEAYHSFTADEIYTEYPSLGESADKDKFAIDGQNRSPLNLNQRFQIMRLQYKPERDINL